MADFAQDVLTRVINIHWGGAKFVYGTLSDNALYYVKVMGEDSEPDQRTIPAPGPGAEFGLAAYGSSYRLIIENEGEVNEEKKPTFLVCGAKAFVADTIGDIKLMAFSNIIYRSTDGLDWTIVYQHDGTPTWDKPFPGANTIALVWDDDEKAFYYDQNDHQTGDPFDQIFRSSDGTGWSMVSSTPTHGADGYVSAFLSHCAGNDCIDNRGQHVPDGVMGAAGSITAAKPVKPPIINYALGDTTIGTATGGETWGSDQVEVTVETVDTDGAPVTTTTIVTVTGVQKVFCVAVAAGIIMAGGAADIAGETGAVALSFDHGVTWRMLAERASPVTTMVAKATHPTSSARSRRNARL